MAYEGRGEADAAGQGVGVSAQGLGQLRGVDAAGDWWWRGGAKEGMKEERGQGQGRREEGVMSGGFLNDALRGSPYDLSVL